MILASLIFAAAAMSNPTDLFLQRIGDLGFPQQRRVITQGALPPGWTPPAPLPQGVTMLGSELTPNAGTQLFYAPIDAPSAAQRYRAQLRAAGFMERLGVMGRSGFVTGQFGADNTLMCKGNAAISVAVPQPQDMRVNFAANAAFTQCAAQQLRITSPLPNLIAPAGTVMLLEGGGGGATLGVNSSVFSSASFKTGLSAKHLLAAFASQMRAAHWKAQPAFYSPQGAAQMFSYDRGNLHWSSSLMIFATRSAHTYEGRLEASGTPDLGPPAAAIAPARPARKLSPSQRSAAIALAQRIAAQYSVEGAQPALYVGTVPPGLDARIPVPAGAIVGSMGSSDGVVLYYNLTRAQFDAYLAKLRRNGWMPMPQIATPAGGFAGSVAEQMTTFCKPGLPMLITRARPNTNDVGISSSNKTVSHTCDTAGMIPAFAMQPAPVPQLRAPDGVTMAGGSTGIPGGESGASLVTEKPLADVLAAFAAQFTAKGWSARSPVVSDALGSQSFGYSDNNGKKWQVVLTIYRSDANPKTYYAFIDATPL